MLKAIRTGQSITSILGCSRKAVVSHAMYGGTVSWTNKKLPPKAGFAQVSKWSHKIPMSWWQIMVTARSMMDGTTLLLRDHHFPHLALVLHSCQSSPTWLQYTLTWLALWYRLKRDSSLNTTSLPVNLWIAFSTSNRDETFDLYHMKHAGLPWEWLFPYDHHACSGAVVLFRGGNRGLRWYILSSHPPS